MSTLIPAPVTTEDLINSVSDINAFNDGVKTQLASPRTTGTDTITVAVKDNPMAPAFESGVASALSANNLVAGAEDFITAGVEVGDFVVNTTAGTSAEVTAVTNLTTLALDADIFTVGTEGFKLLKPTYFVQKFGGGEWQQSNMVHGENPLTAYTLPVNGATVNVHDIVYPWVIADIANYPAK